MTNDEDMNPYMVVIEACDDCTYAIVDMSDSQAAWFEHVVGVINGHSTGGCQPRLELKPLDEATRYERERAEVEAS